MPVPGTPLVRHVAKANAGGFQELAGCNAVLRFARELGLPVPVGGLAESAAALIADAARAVEGTDARTTPQADATADGASATTGTAPGSRPPDGPYAELLHRFATGLAVGLASLVTVLDPELIVLSGGVVAAGGETLRALVQTELAELAVPRPRLVLGTVQEHPVLAGALQSALATTRDEVFDTSR
jgi:predicted NBD/HSP70 family sugar kinase